LKKLTLERLLKYFAFVLILLILVNKSSGQYNGSYKIWDISADSAVFCFDTLLVYQPSLTVYQDSVLLTKGVDYQFLSGLNCLKFDSSLLGKPLTIFARVVDMKKVNMEVQFKNPAIIEQKFQEKPIFYSYADEMNTQGDIFSGSGLDINGNISRGIGFGNNQDLILNSNLNLQIAGTLGNEINILAAVSDENNPIQPEGNTQQIQDFDQVFIQFSKDSTFLTVGDFLMTSGRSDYFKKFYKKSRGLQVLHTDSIFGGRNHTSAEFAVSRGRFARNEIQGQEGNQGPYRLVGNNNEIFIIIIAGTEAVYVDGKLLSRGQQNDYVIDYNTGELTFMPKVLINQFSRIVIEFQYADRNYARSVFHATNEFSKGKFAFRVGMFSEQDNRNQPFQQSLDFFDSFSNRGARDVLAEAGDDITKMVIPNINSYTAFQTDRIMYLRRDTLGMEFYVYTDNPEADSVFYAVTFTQVGQGNGNYRQKVSLANGRVFEFVYPVNGVPQGNYEPVVQLVAPVKNQLFTAAVDFRPDSLTLFSVEVATSVFDKNTFSPLDNEDNAGYAIRTLFERESRIKLRNRTLKWMNRIHTEFTDDKFRYIERYRNVEFERTWNRQYANPTTDRGAISENIIAYNSVIKFSDKLQIGYELATFEQGDVFKGRQAGGFFDIDLKGFKIIQKGSVISTDRKSTGIPGVTDFNTHNDAHDLSGRISKKVKNSTFAAHYSMEESVFNIDTTADYSLMSYRFFQYGADWTLEAAENITSNVNISRRVDFMPVGSAFERAVGGNNLNIDLVKTGKKWNDRLNLTLNFRDIDDYDTARQDKLPERTILSRVEYQISVLQKSLTSNTYYQIGTGREQRREFTYIEVPAGRGTHTWIDYNENGIQEINEFEPSVFMDQARFIKVMVPTNEFIRSNLIEFNQSLRIQPPVKWQTHQGFTKLVSRFSNIGSVRIDRKSTDNRLESVLNPFDLSIADTALLSLSSLYKNTLFFNRSNPKFGAEYNYQNTMQKLFLIQGFDSRDVLKHALSTRSNITANWSVILSGEMGERKFFSDFSPNRNFDFEFSEIKPEVFWQPGKSFRIGAFYKYYEAFNEPDFGGETAFWHENGVELRTFLKNMTTIDARFSYIRVNYSGSSFSPVGFDMLSGFQNGRNLNWNILVGGKIGKNIQVSINYEGRSTEEAKTVHIGRAEARYLF
jgi:hypothetical protein